MRYLTLLFLISCGWAQTVKNAADPRAGLCPGVLAAIYGTNLAPMTEASDYVPRPVTLGGIRVRVTDSAKQTRLAPLSYASPDQINFEIPEDSALGPATVAIENPRHPVSVRIEIEKIAPALFAADRSGIAAATAVRVIFPSLDKTPVSVYECRGAQCRLTPMSQQIDSTIYISLFGTGIRGVSTLADVTVNIGGRQVTPTYAGSQLDSPGEQRIDFPLPRDLHGELTASVTIDGITSNAVRLRVE
ncbi:MAG TPA: hypothetical protein VKX39_08475 [Bryobacteraceae bacterium]|jgi:uncharacterized protein (TIGR03437 family)|nr:hypothetical protein [Bryobacteraceae bacterium]